MKRNSDGTRSQIDHKDSKKGKVNMNMNTVNSIGVEETSKDNFPLDRL